MRRGPGVADTGSRDVGVSLAIEARKGWLLRRRRNANCNRDAYDLNKKDLLVAGPPAHLIDVWRQVLPPASFRIGAEYSMKPGLEIVFSPVGVEKVTRISR
jgi:hypothetical protein